MGFFSWYTQDTHRSIANRYSPRETFTVYMVDPRDGTLYPEDDYEGYGVFGGKDFYELVAELNNLEPDKSESDPKYALRSAGIRLAFSEHFYESPLLLEDPENWREFVGKEPEADPAQGFFYDDFRGPEQVYRYADDIPDDCTEECSSCGTCLVGADAVYLHKFAGGGQEWLCPDCAAQLLGESLSEHDSIEYMG